MFETFEKLGMTSVTHDGRCEDSNGWSEWYSIERHKGANWKKLTSDRQPKTKKTGKEETIPISTCGYYCP